MPETTGATKAAKQPVNKLNPKVYDWARQQLKKRVGPGECWDLADRALRHAGARSSTTTGKYDDYVWGTSIAPGEAIQGDILQLHNHRQIVTIETQTTYSDGTVDIDVLEPDELRPHHTAVVAANKGSKGLEILEQNYPEGAPVVHSTLYIKSGLIETGKPKPGTVHKNGKVHHVMVKVTKSVKVSGWVWAYRPQAKA
jgi:hypothetical protein